MFYDIYCELCADNGLTPSGGAAAIKFNRATVTTWKNTGKAPKGDLLTEISKYFEVPVDFLLERPPFDHWNEINKDRRGFVAAVGVEDDILRLIWGLNRFDLYSAPIKTFVSFVNVMVISAKPTADGGWDITLQPNLDTRKGSSHTGKGVVSDADIKFALFGDAEIDDDVLDEVKRFAKFAIEQKEQRKQSD